MKIIFFSTYYQAYLNSLYRKNPGLESKPYDVQMKALINGYFGYWGSFVNSFTKLGFDARLIIPNCKPLQQIWAKENNIKFDESNWQFSIPIEQVKKCKPDIFYTSSMFEYFGWFIDEIKKHSKIVFGWVSCQIPAGAKMNKLDLVLSSLPYFVDNFRREGINSEFLSAAFDPNILQILGPAPDRDIDFSFIGNLTRAHSTRIKLVKTLIEQTPLQVYGTGVKTIPDDRSFFKRLFKPSIYQQRFMGEKWGLDMYQTLQRSKITFNSHIDISNGYIGNMRMFEATGIGTLLLTDGKKAPLKIFNDDEVAYYDSVDEAIEKFRYYSDHPVEREPIAKKGQARTLSEYNPDNVCKKLYDYILKYMD